MLSFGLMTLNLHHEDGYFTEIARRAKKHHIKCYRFVPSKINPHTEMVEGELFLHEQGHWEKANFPIPNILYDRCFYKEEFHSKQCKAIVNWLKTNDKAEFLGFGLPNKLQLYEALAHTKLSPYLPKTLAAVSPETILSFLQDWQRVMMKPIDGSQGNGIYYMEKQGKQVIVKIDKGERQVEKTLDKDTFLHWLRRVLSKKKFLLQPYYPLTNENKEPYDIRSLLQKDEKGEWQTIGKGVRVGKKERIISNVSAGGSIMNYEAWLQRLEPANKQFIIEEVEDILKTLPSLVENKFPPLYELGVDIGIARDLSIWILDINSKPGRKVILQNHPELKELLYESPLRYARFIAGKENVHHEKKIPH